jgi:hypothetical protein
MNLEVFHSVTLLNLILILMNLLFFRKQKKNEIKQVFIDIEIN